MELMKRRRELMIQQEQKYIQNGLVLWLDGIDKGNTAGAWTDKVAGHVFEAGESGFTNGANYAGFDATLSQYMQNSTYDPVDGDDSTIEIVATDFTMAQTKLIFMPKGRPSGGATAAAGIYQDSVIWAVGAQQSKAYLPNGFKVLSISKDRAICNGESVSWGTADVWGSVSSTYSFIAKRQSGNFFTGKIHSIRIYSRKLTADEMLHNQRIDNKRFNLGLSI